jgi:mRNA interferase RelE/StbE
MSNPFSLTFSEVAEEDLKRLDKSVAARILKKLEWLAENAETVHHVPVTGEWSGFYRLRVGDYRALYGLDRPARLIAVEAIGHRREIYDQ